MRILYLSNSMNLGGGVQKCIFMLASRYKKEKNEVFVASSGGEYIDELKKSGITHYKIINPENKNPLNIFKNFLTLYKIIKDNKIELIHSHHRMTTLYAKVLSRILKVKTIHSAHLTTTDKKFMTKKTLNNLPIISVSKGVKNGLVDYYGLNQNAIKVIYNSIEFNNKNSEKSSIFKEEKESGKFIIGVVSRLEEVKGINIFLAAISDFIKKNKELEISAFIFGSGTLEKELKEFTSRNNLNSVVNFMGNVTNISDYMKDFDIIVQSSYQEGLPLSLIEATSLGIPIIATDIPGTNEVAINDYNAMLVNVASSEEISRAIKKIYGNKELKRNLGLKSKEHFNNNFKKENYYNEHMAFYKKVLYGSIEKGEF